MNRMKRTLCLACAIIFAFTMVLAGCSGSKKNTPEPAKTSEPAKSEPAKTEATKAPLPQVEISWYYVGNPQKEVALVEAEANKYLKDKINATIKLNCLDWGSFGDKTSVMIASGEVFDILFTAAWSNYRQNVAKGAFVDITDLWDKYAPKTKKQLHPAFIEGTKVDGRSYGIAANKELAHTWGFIYRDDIAKKYNLNMTSIKTFADLGPMLKVVKEKEPDMIGMAVDAVDNTMQLPDFDPVGDQTVPGKLYPNKDTKVINEFDTPEIKSLLKTVREFYLAGYIRKDASTVKDRRPDIKSGKAFCYMSSLKPFANEEVSVSNGFPFGQVELTKPFITGNDCGGSMQAISRTSKNPERALMFLEIFNTDKFFNNLINYGIEGKHYVKKGDNVIDYAPGLDAKTSGYAPNSGWVFGNQYLNYFFPGQNLAKWDKFKEFNDAGVPSKILGFNFDNDPVKTEIAACKNAADEFNPGLFTGSLDPDVYLPKLLDKLKASGVDRIITEKQKQVDAWLAKKK